MYGSMEAAQMNRIIIISIVNKVISWCQSHSPLSAPLCEPLSSLIAITIRVDAVFYST